MPTPPHWKSNRDKPMCRICGCIEFSDDLICQGCDEPLVVLPFKKHQVLKLIAADKWGNHLPKDYKNRCFLCGWKSRVSIFSLIPKDPTDLMAADMWGTLPDAKQLTQLICGSRPISDRMIPIFGILAHTGDNAIFKVQANKKYKELASKYKEGENFSFCRKCAEEEAKPIPAEPPPLESISLEESMASAMKKEVATPVKPWVPPTKPQGKMSTPGPLPTRTVVVGSATKGPPSKTMSPNDPNWGMDDDNWDETTGDFLPDLEEDTDSCYDDSQESSAEWGDSW